jgi:hypothetical protein
LYINMIELEGVFGEGRTGTDHAIPKQKSGDSAMAPIRPQAVRSKT